ncbi:DUF3618 domain-containing protein [Devosia sp. Naph2]|uniref:DUF3618 domain-containing protein n=1 Tax=Devosia polycyclovorans TaxID=3345148 RepID=UPI0035CF5C6C
MAYDDNKSSEQLQREVEQQRAQLEDRIDSIQEKLSPGQLIDEMLSYTKNGGGQFMSSLQRNVTANPLPVALLGVSLAWLMAKPASAQPESDRVWDDSINGHRGYDSLDEDEDYPVAIITGSSMQRVSNKPDHSGKNYSEFIDDAGKKYRAASDEAGRRAGHFMDETGKRYKGFQDNAGKQVQHFRDEAGNLLDEASGWASHSWKDARSAVGRARDAVMHRASDGKARAGEAGRAMGEQMNSLNHTIMQQFRDQPLVAGALAFAAGAAFGSALPHTEHEDALMGEAADKVKGKAGEQAEALYDQGREKAAEIYEGVSEQASKLYDKAKGEASEAARPDGSPSHH